MLPIVRFPAPVLERFEAPERLEFTVKVVPSWSVRSWFKMRLEMVEFPLSEPLSIRMLASARFDSRIKFPERTASVPLNVWFRLVESRTKLPDPVFDRLPLPLSEEFDVKLILSLLAKKVAD